MAIITISRGSLAAGQTLAGIVAQRLGYRCVGSEALTQAAGQHGIPEPEVTRMLEKRPTFWERLSVSRDWHLTVLRMAMCEVAEAGDVVYHGLAGHELLQGVSHLLKVRVIAPMDQRLKSVMEGQRLSAEAAQRWIDQVDHDRLQRMRYLFGIDWRDPALYDVVLNLAHMSLDSAAATVVELAARPEFQPTVQSAKALRDMALASRVKATVLEQFPGAAIDVQADDGRVSVNGNVQALADEREPLIAMVKGLPGVQSVQAELSFQAMPYAQL